MNPSSPEEAKGTVLAKCSSDGWVELFYSIKANEMCVLKSKHFMSRLQHPFQIKPEHCRGEISGRIELFELLTRFKG